MTEKRYSIRKLGMVSYADTNSIRRARKLLREAEKIQGYGFVVVDNTTNEIVDFEEE